MEPRSRYTLRFADGGRLELGRRTVVMGILNVTPDSFSDGGRYSSIEDVVAAAEAMVQSGVDIIDVGGESTRPGAETLTPEAEIERVTPAIDAIKSRLDVRVSVDTRKAAVAGQALAAGADLVNDVSGLRDPDMLPLLIARRVPVVVMHMRGDPVTMQRCIDYEDLIGAVTGFLGDVVESATAAGLSDDKILVDPGIGFGKSAEGSLTLLRRLAELRTLRRPILVGASRKSFIGTVLDLSVDERLEGSLAIAALASAQGAHVVRAHDVVATLRVVRMIDAVRETAKPDA